MLRFRGIAPFVVLVAASCSDEAPVETGRVVIGIKSDLRAGVDVQSLHVRLESDGAVVRDEDIPTPDGFFPEEFWFDPAPTGTRVQALVEPFGASGPALLAWRGATDVVAPRQILLEGRLQFSCVTGVDGSSAPECGPDERCVTGVCQPAYTPPAKLPDYSSAWTAAPDACKPEGGGTPSVMVGQGQADYLPMEDGEVAQIEAGPQGGYHIWVAIRVKHLSQSGSITEVSGSLEGGGPLPPYKVIFTFDQDEGGYCKLPGLRFQIASNIDEANALLGKTATVDVKVTDKFGAVGTGSRTVKLSDDIIGL